MDRWTRAAAGAAAVAVIGATTVGIARSRWLREAQDDLMHLREEGGPTEGSFVALPSSVPVCVARYLDYAFSLDQRRIRAVHVVQRGEMRGDARGSWNRFAAQEHIATDSPGYVWDATIYAGRVPLVAVHDRYVDGRGASKGSLLGAMPLPGPAHSPLVDAAALMRYVAEAAWYPTVLEPSGHVRWDDLGEYEARVTFTHGATQIALDARFNERGELMEAAGMRGRAVGRELEPTRWVVRYGDYRRVDGMMIPCFGEVSWAPPEGEYSVWRGQIDEISYEYA